MMSPYHLSLSHRTPTPTLSHTPHPQKVPELSLSPSAGCVQHASPTVFFCCSALIPSPSLKTPTEAKTLTLKLPHVSVLQSASPQPGPSSFYLLHELTRLLGLLVLLLCLRLQPPLLQTHPLAPCPCLHLCGLSSPLSCSGKDGAHGEGAWGAHGVHAPAKNHHWNPGVSAAAAAYDARFLRLRRAFPLSSPFRSHRCSCLCLLLLPLLLLLLHPQLRLQ